MNRPLTPSLSPSEGERVPGGRVRGWFMVPMHAKNERGLSMNLVGRASSRALISIHWIRARRSLAPPFMAPTHVHPQLTSTFGGRCFHSWFGLVALVLDDPSLDDWAGKWFR